MPINDEMLEGITPDTLERQRELTILTSRLQQCFVGSISSFENHFGVLWGHGLPESRLTDKQKQFLTVWKECRDELFDKGNDLIKAAEKDLGLLSEQ